MIFLPFFRCHLPLLLFLPSTDLLFFYLISSSKCLNLQLEWVIVSYLSWEWILCIYWVMIIKCESSLEGSSPSTIVSSSHIGRRVDVEGVGEGTLKYVGGINGKNGLFCGIELDQPNGKHDGTFQGEKIRLLISPFSTSTPLLSPFPSSFLPSSLHDIVDWIEREWEPHSSYSFTLLLY